MEQTTFDLALPIAIGSDHAGFGYKEEVISYLEGKGVQVKDFGTYSADSVDYPDFAHPVAIAVEAGNACVRYPYLRQRQWRSHHGEQTPGHPCCHLLGR